MAPHYEVLSDLSGYIENIDKVWVEKFASNSLYGDDYNYILSAHWHTDLEYIYLLESPRDFIVNGKRVTVEKGQCIFFNSKRLHCFSNCPLADCERIVVRIDPNIITDLLKDGKQFCERKFGHGNIDYLVLDPGIPWQNDILNIIKSMPELYDDKDRPLPLITAAFNLLGATCDHIEDATSVKTSSVDIKVFLKMVDYIEKNYANSISTEELAQAGNISRTRVFRLFEKYASIMPHDYILSYRLDRAAALLINTQLSVLEISMMCGFTSSSYFSKVFHRERGSSPREYRKSFN